MELKFKKGKPFVPQYLKAINKLMKGNTFNDWLLENGKLFGAFEPSEKHKKIYKEYKHLGKAKQCYHSAQMLACHSQYNNIEYYEGYYVTEFNSGAVMLPIEHAWCVLDGEVIDLVAYKNKMVVREYFGVPIDKKLVRRTHLKTGWSEAMLWRVWRSMVDGKEIC